MILGRWASSAIMAYVEEALAELAIRGDRTRKPGQVKNTEPPDEWESALEPPERRIAKAKEKIRKLGKSKQESIREDALLRAITVTPKERRWLKSTRPNGKIHREASRLDDLPSWMWTTGRGWPFGTSEFYEWMKPEDLPTQGEPAFCTSGCDRTKWASDECQVRVFGLADQPTSQCERVSKSTPSV